MEHTQATETGRHSDRRSSIVAWLIQQKTSQPASNQINHRYALEAAVAKEEEAAAAATAKERQLKAKPEPNAINVRSEFGSAFNNSSSVSMELVFLYDF